MQNRNSRSQTIEPKCEACGFFMTSTVSYWPSCLTNLEYSDCCYTAACFSLAHLCTCLACHLYDDIATVANMFSHLTQNYTDTLLASFSFIHTMADTDKHHCKMDSCLSMNSCLTA